MSKTTSLPRSAFALAALFPLIQGCAGSTTDPAEDLEDEATAESTEAITYGGTLSLQMEKKISTLLGASGTYEASGVQVLGSDLYVVFDSSQKVAKIPTTLPTGGATYTPGSLSSTEQYEGITFDSHNTQHFYLVQELSPAMIVQLDGSGSAQGESYQSTGITFSSANTGFEGIAWIRRNDNDYLLALCEAGNCGSSTGNGGPGMIKILAQNGNSWSYVGWTKLCADANCTTGPFDDYSDIALYPVGDGSYKVAITSQESRQVWVGTLSASGWGIGGGKIYDFPSSGYCNIEGVTFLSSTKLAMVSDEYKVPQGQTAETACYTKEQSVHIFNLP